MKEGRPSDDEWTAPLRQTKGSGSNQDGSHPEIACCLQSYPFPSPIGRALGPVCLGRHPDPGPGPDLGRGRPCLDPGHPCRSDCRPYHAHADPNVPTKDSHSMPTSN
jgi:hypothetical protein